MQAANNRVLIAACFLSGAASLSYEILWTRAFSLILGSTTEAAALIFAAFLTGLAIGAWLFGALSQRLRSPLRTYAWLEVGIAFAAVTTGLVLHNNADAIGAALGPGGSRYVVVFLIALAVVLPATLLMGGTLPVLLSAARDRDGDLTIVGHFYGINTLGAAVGTLLTGFVAIRLLGVTTTFFCAMLLNVGVAVLAFTLSRSEVAAGRPATPEAPPRGSARLPEYYLLLVALCSGVVVLSLEIVWARFAGFFIGNRTYAFTTLMFAVLTLLACGSVLSAHLYGRIAVRDTAHAYRVFNLLLSLAAVAVVFSAWAAWWLIGNQAGFEADLPGSRNNLLVYRFGEAFALLAPPLVTLGVLFPLTIALARDAAADIGATSARYYVANAVGVVIGSLGTGFALLSLLGSFGTLKLLTLLLLVLTLPGLARGGRSALAWTLPLAALATWGVLALPANYPPQTGSGETVVFEEEDAHGLFRVTELASGRLQVTNNRSELIYHLGAFSTDYVQQMQGHLGVHFNPGASRALVIGSGYGITAGALALHEGIEEVDAVEILPAMVAAADLFEPNNFGYHRHDKVRVIVGDGRHFLLREGRKYDIISLNVSDPHLPGGAALFHRDFYELAKRHLKPGGVVIQHVFGSEAAVIANTLADSFDYMQFSPSYANGYNAVAAMSDLAPFTEAALTLPVEAVRQLRRSGSRRALPTPAHQPYEQLPEWMHSHVIATDDFPAVEFSWNAGEKLLFINE